eukprot:283809_1
MASLNTKIMCFLLVITGNVLLLVSLQFSYIPAVRVVSSQTQRQKSQKHNCNEQQLIQFNRCKESLKMQHVICTFCDDVRILFLSELGQGSNGKAYSVRISENNPITNLDSTPYAIKMSWYHEYCERLQKEYHILSTLSNPHIPKLHPRFMYYQWLWPKTGNMHCLIVMQQIPNTINLHTLINSTSRVYQSYFTSAQQHFNSILRVVLQCYHDIQSALHQCHDQHIYHLDLKLLNILFDTTTFQCYLIDFGRSMQMNDFVDINNDKLVFSYLETGFPTPYDYLKLTVSKRKKVIHSHEQKHLFSSWGRQAALKELQRYAALSNMYKLANEFMRVIMYFYWRLPPKEIGCNLYHFKLNELNLRLMYKPPLMNHRHNRLSRVWCRRKHQIQYFKRSTTYQLEQNRTVLDRNVLGRLYRDILDVIDHGLTWFPSTLCKGADARDHKLDAIKDISFQTIYSNQTYVVNEKGNCA